MPGINYDKLPPEQRASATKLLAIVGIAAALVVLVIVLIRFA